MTKHSYLDAATRTATAFATWAEFELACATYVPTLMVGPDTEPHDAWAVGTLQRALEARGLRYWAGTAA